MISSFTLRLAYGLLMLSVLLLGSCTTVVSVPEYAGKIQPRAKALTEAEIKQLLVEPPQPAVVKRAEYSPIPQQPVEMPQAGDTTPLGVKVTKELELAFNSYLGGDGEKALSELAELSKSGSDPALLWQASFLKVKILLMMGRVTAAEEELENTSRFEQAVFGSDLNTLALKGEAKIWQEDYDGGLRDFAGVVGAIGDWELPIQFRSFPTNRQSLYYLTTAKLRAYTGIAGVYIFKEDYLKALAWSKETERLFNNTHFVVNHPLYGMNDEVYADNYYGRAMNLTFLACATLAVTGDLEAAERLFQQAEGFYRAMGYTVGRVTVAAFKARILNSLGRPDLSYSAAQQAIKLAVEHGLADYVWRIGVLAGVTLYEEGRMDEAERMFRQAQDAVDAISGKLSTDRAKIRFGVGKSTIVYHLAEIDIQKKNWDLLFSDLERARARSFVDLLTDQALTRNREADLVSEIRGLESKILKQRLINMAPGQMDPAGIQNEKQLHEKRDAKLSVLRSRDLEIADLISVRYTSLSDVRNRLKDGEAIAYAVPGKPGDTVRFLLITSDSILIKELAVSYENISQLVENFALAFKLGEGLRGFKPIEKKSSTSKLVTKERAVEDIQNTFNLSNWPVRAKLYVVPSADLYFLPWGVLETSYPVVVLPTGGWISRKPQRFKQDRQIVIVGDPDFGGDLPQLPGARQEAIAVGKIYQEKPLLGSQARERELRSHVGRGVEIIHLATHGIFQDRQPLNSAFFLTADGKAVALTASRIFEDPLPAKLVILSGCETGLGKTIAGDDLLGLTRSFYLGGAVSTLSSLWQIEDVGTMAFMEKFHQLAVDGDYGKAWLGARNHVKGLGYPASVYAAFVLGGASQ